MGSILGGSGVDLGGIWEVSGGYLGLSAHLWRGSWGIWSGYGVDLAFVRASALIENLSKIYRKSIEHLSKFYRTSIENPSNIYRKTIEHLSNICRFGVDLRWIWGGSGGYLGGIWGMLALVRTSGVDLGVSGMDLGRIWPPCAPPP